MNLAAHLDFALDVHDAPVPDEHPRRYPGGLAGGVIALGSRTARPFTCPGDRSRPCDTIKVSSFMSSLQLVVYLGTPVDAFPVGLFDVLGITALPPFQSPVTRLYHESSNLPKRAESFSLSARCRPVLHDPRHPVLSNGKSPPAPCTSPI